MKLYEHYLLKSVDGLIKHSNLRDLGKLFAEANEHYQVDWINNNTNLDVIKRTDDTGDGYDLITTDGVMRIQTKLRAKGIHIEQTRRNSVGNNIEENNTGYTRYRVNETDIFFVSKPVLDDYANMEKWELIAIPSVAVQDPNREGFCLPSIPKKIWKEYVGKTKETLEMTYRNLTT